MSEYLIDNIDDSLLEDQYRYLKNLSRTNKEIDDLLNHEFFDSIFYNTGFTLGEKLDVLREFIKTDTEKFRQKYCVSNHIEDGKMIDPITLEPLSAIFMNGDACYNFDSALQLLLNNSSNPINRQPLSQTFIDTVKRYQEFKSDTQIFKDIIQLENLEIEQKRKTLNLVEVHTPIISIITQNNNSILSISNEKTNFRIAPAILIDGHYKDISIKSIFYIEIYILSCIKNLNIHNTRIYSVNFSKSLPRNMSLSNCVVGNINLFIVNEVDFDYISICDNFILKNVFMEKVALYNFNINNIELIFETVDDPTYISFYKLKFKTCKIKCTVETKLYFDDEHFEILQLLGDNCRYLFDFLPNCDTIYVDNHLNYQRLIELKYNGIVFLKTDNENGGYRKIDLSTLFN